MSLSGSLARLAFPLARLKTGTPCRLDGRTIDLAGLEAQPGDDPPPRFRVFAPAGERPPLPQRRCHLTYTTERTHDDHPRQPAPLAALRRAHRRVGPRYCPSIEDKVVRFADKERHQIFLEPRGWTPSRSTQRHLDLAALRRAARAAALDPGPRARRDDPPGLRRRVRLHRSDASSCRRWRPARRGPVPRGPDQRHLGLRGGRRAGLSPASTPRSRRRRRPSRWSCAATRPTPACSSTI
jgi:hypothetical protein